MNRILWPTQDLVLVEVIGLEETTPGGIVIPVAARQASQRHANRGIVKDVGPDVERIVIGEVVLFEKYSGVSVNDSDTMRIMAEKDILAIEREESYGAWSVEEEEDLESE